MHKANCTNATRNLSTRQSVATKSEALQASRNSNAVTGLLGQQRRALEAPHRAVIRRGGHGTARKLVYTKAAAAAAEGAMILATMARLA